MLLSLFSSRFCQTPFAGLLLRQGEGMCHHPLSIVPAPPPEWVHKSPLRTVLTKSPGRGMTIIWTREAKTLRRCTPAGTNMKISFPSPGRPISVKSSRANNRNLAEHPACRLSGVPGHPPGVPEGFPNLTSPQQIVTNIQGIWFEQESIISLHSHGEGVLCYVLSFCRTTPRLCFNITSSYHSKLP